jgi:uncharacterized membrane-anchored protein
VGSFYTKHIRNNAFLLLTALVALYGEPASSNPNEYAYRLEELDQSLTLSRGVLAPTVPDEFYLRRDDACIYVQQQVGWSQGACGRVDGIVLGTSAEPETLIIEKPVSTGYLRLDDWNSTDKNIAIHAIWERAVRAARAEGTALGMDIKAERWLAYPTLNPAKSYMYYAILLNRAGKRLVTIKAMLFDRQGYVTFRLRSAANDLDSNAIRALVEARLGAYRPHERQAYADFVEGDRVAATGLLGAIAGVTYEKAGAGGALDLLLIILGKLWFIPLLPFAGVLRHLLPTTS